MNPIRVLQFGMTSNPGGVESFLMNYYRNIDHDKIQFDFVNMYGQIAYQEEIEELGGYVHHIKHFKKHPLNNYFTIKKIMKEYNYRIVHVNMLSAAYILPLIAARKSGAKCIIAHSHNSATPPGNVRNLLNRINKARLHRNATHFFACSKLAGDWMFGRRSKENNIRVINNAIDALSYRFNPEKREETRRKLNLEGKFVIGHVGRFHYQKNHKFIIDIFHELLQKQQNCVLLLIGEGELMNSMKQLVTNLGIGDSVMFMGIRSDINDLMQTMDVFLLPSYFEGLPLVLIEAQASGLKCIVSDSVTTEVDITGLVEFMSLKLPADMWAQKLLEYQSDYEREDTYQKIINAGYDIHSSVKSLEEFYKQWQLEFHRI